MLLLQSAKEKIKKNWQELPVDGFKGKTFLWLFSEMEGREVVAEILFAGHLIYLCGTNVWVQRMKEKGHKACSFAEAISTLEASGTPQLLENYVSPPDCDTQNQLF